MIRLLGAKVRGRCSGEEILAMPKRSAFVFITTDSDASGLVIEDLRRIDGAKEVYAAQGAFDVVAKVSGESFDHLRKIIQSRIGNLSSKKSTSTLILT
jgi:hypothetical protein